MEVGGAQENSKCEEKKLTPLSACAATTRSSYYDLKQGASSHAKSLIFRVLHDEDAKGARRKPLVFIW